ncbi:MAG: DNA circularization N-terminal domain-containing protein [Alphaproteobacteria bacterium]|nr:DNA circularization N-terminal domain-containing protein [Alphaproteobacteria bacterium]
MDRRFDIEEAPASFRGVPFYVKKRSRDGGRRGPTHEMPQKDEPDGEDLGRKVRVFKVEALVLGDDHVARANRLLSALEDVAGPGIYRDPWHGSWSVICRSVSAVDSDDHGGVTTLSISFEESGDTRYPLAGTDTAGRVEQAAGGVSTAAAGSFDTIFTIGAHPQFVADDAGQLVGQALARLTGAGLPRLDPTVSLGVPDLSASLSGFDRGLTAAMSGGRLGASLAGLFRDIGGAAFTRRGGLGDAVAARTAFAGLSGFGQDQPAVLGVTPARLAQASNRQALADLVRRLALAEEARALAATDWVSFDDAMADRSATLTRLDGVQRRAGETGDDAMFAAIQTLKAAVTTDVATRALPKPHLRRLTLDTTLPARVVAHRELGDARLADDIVARNHVGHAAFIPAGRPLEILDNGANRRRRP